MLHTPLAAFLVLSPLSTLALAQSDCGAVPSSEVIGFGTPGTAGIPQLDQVGWPTVGERFGVRVVGAPPLAPGLLVASTTQSPTLWPSFGATSFPALPGLTAVFTTNLAGNSGVLFEIDPVPAALCGLEVIGQAVLVDDAATGGLSFTPARRAVFGNAIEPVFPQRELPGSPFVSDTAIQAMEWLDVDGDGLTDLVTSFVNGSFHRIQVRKNLGNGEFGLQTVSSITVPFFQTNLDGLDLHAGDVNGDGVLDLVVNLRTTLELWTLLGTGISFSAPFLGSASGTQRAIDLVDYDRDGSLDVVVRPNGVAPYGSWVTEKVRVMLGQGDGTFLDPFEIDAGLGATDTEIADVDADGLDEMILVTPTEVLVFDAPAGQSMTVVQALPKAIGTRVGGFGDVDGDGFGDFVLANVDSIGVYPGSASGQLGAPTVHAAEGANSRFVDLFDLDGDGRDEILSVNDFLVDEFIAEGIPPDRQEVVVVGDVDGEFAQIGSFGARPHAHSIEVVDMDGDGQQELAILGLETYWDPSDITFLEPDGARGFVSATPVDVNPAEVIAAATADMDLDGDVDVVTVLVDVATGGEILLADGQGGLVSSGSLGAPIPDNGIELVDLDLDGIPDLLGAGSNGRFQVRLGVGDGTFEPPMVYVTPPGQLSDELQVLAVDITGDGNKDVVSIFLGQAWLYPYDPVTILGPPVAFAIGPESPICPGLEITPFHADDDGLLDLVVYRDCRTDIYLGTGPAQFALHAPIFAFGTDIEPLVPIDLDLDGDLDLLRGEVLLPLENVGGGDFVQHPQFGGVSDPFPGPGSYTLADVVGDARPEILLRQSPLQSNEANRIFELVSVGSGFDFEKLAKFALGEEVEWMLAADLDGTGGDDLLSLSEFPRILPSKD